MFALVKSFTVLALVWVHVTGSLTSPTVSVHFSADSFYSMIVIPGGDTLNTEYFPPGFRFERPQNLEQHYSAYGIFCTRGTDSIYRPLWMAELPYEKAPVTTLLENQGKYVVMLDEWQNTGRGDNAVVIFDRHGWMIRNLSLTDMMPAERVAKFDRCAFGVWWKYDQQILQESDQLEIRMESNNDEVGPFSNLLVYEDYLRLDLKTGVVLSLKSKFQNIVDTYPDTCPGNPICKTSRYFRYLLNHPNPDIKARIDSLHLQGSPMDSLRKVYACFANDSFWVAGAAMQLIGRPVTLCEQGLATINISLLVQTHSELFDSTLRDSFPVIVRLPDSSLAFPLELRRKTLTEALLFGGEGMFSLSYELENDDESPLAISFFPLGATCVFWYGDKWICTGSPVYLQKLSFGTLVYINLVGK